jgi:4-amino-4-deoxy-L-arabinose transferase-like glycosyltransferase
MRMRTRKTITTLAACAGLAALLAIGLSHPIQNDNEGLYASVARDMLATHSWLVPRLDGVPYLEKPPLLYWITALAYSLFGESEVTSRAAPILGSLLMLGAVYFFARRHWGRVTALCAAFIAASCPLVVGLTRMLMFDMLFTGFYAWALVMLHEGLVANERRWVRASYAMLALAVLTKGWVAVALFGPIALVTIALGGREAMRARILALLDPFAIAIFVLVAIPWHWLAFREQPGFGWFYLVNEHLLRFLDQREPRDYYHGPVWYYVPRVIASALPWILVLAIPASKHTERDDKVMRGFLWACVLIPLAFFSASAAKANYYMIVGLPPLVLLIARRIATIDARRVAWMPLLWTAVLATAAWGLRDRLHFAPGALHVALASALVLGSLSAAFFFTRRMAPAVLACALMAVPLAWCASAWLTHQGDKLSARHLAQQIRARGFDEVYVYRDFENVSAIAYYWDGPIGVIDSQSNELDFGLKMPHDENRFPSGAQFVSAHHATVAVIALEKQRRALEAAFPRSRLVHLARFGNVHLYEWRPAPPLQTASAARKQRLR